MEPMVHELSELFAQLGEPNDPASIEDFIARNGSTVCNIELHEAPFWSPSQAEFIREALADDSDWAIVVDRLNRRLLDCS